MEAPNHYKLEPPQIALTNEKEEFDFLESIAPKYLQRKPFKTGVGRDSHTIITSNDEGLLKDIDSDLTALDNVKEN